MKSSARLAVLAAIASTLLLGACHRHEEAASSAPAQSTSTAIPPAPTGAMAPAPASSAVPPAASTAMPAPAGTVAAQPAVAHGAFRIDSVKLGDTVAADHKVTRAKATFAPSDSNLYASVVTAGRTDGSTLSARWTYLEGKGQAVTTISQTIATQGPATTTFHVENPNDWPQGKYQVQIAIDGKPVTTETFQIKA